MTSPQPLAGSDVTAFRDGVNILKTCAVLMIVAALLAGVGAFASMTTALSNLSRPRSSVITAAFGGVAAAMVLGGVVMLAATFLYLFRAFDKLKEYDPEKFGTAASIVKLGFPAYGIMTIVMAVMMYVTATQIISGGIHDFRAVRAVETLQTINVLTFIARAAAMVGIGLGTYYINKVSGEGLFMAVAVLFFIAIIIPILAFIAWILVIAGAGGAVSKVSATQATQTQQQTPQTQAVVEACFRGWCG